MIFHKKAPTNMYIVKVRNSIPGVKIQEFKFLQEKIEISQNVKLYKNYSSSIIFVGG